MMGSGEAASSGEPGQAPTRTNRTARDSLAPILRRARAHRDETRLPGGGEGGCSTPGSANQSKTPQQGHGASPGGRDGSNLSAMPHTGQQLSSPSGVRDEMTI
jgi:hypothetical protein